MKKNYSMILTTSPRSIADLHRWNYSCTKNIFKDKSTLNVQISLCRTKRHGCSVFPTTPLKISIHFHFTPYRVKNKIRDWVKIILQWNIHLKFREESLTNYWLKHPQTRNWGWKSPRADTLVFTDVLSTHHSVALFSPNSRPGGRTFPSAEVWLYLE